MIYKIGKLQGCQEIDNYIVMVQNYFISRKNVEKEHTVCWCSSFSSQHFSCLLNMLLDFSELYKMVCDPDETDLDIHIPAVMLPQDAGTSLEKMLTSNSSGKLFLTFAAFIEYSDFPNNWFSFFVLGIWNEQINFLDSAVSVQLYSPLRPPVDIAEVFLWLMAVGTILCSSFWSAWSAREAAIEQDKLLKVTELALCQLQQHFSYCSLQWHSYDELQLLVGWCRWYSKWWRHGQPWFCIYKHGISGPVCRRCFVLFDFALQTHVILVHRAFGSPFLHRRCRGMIQSS